ncbi:MAG: hypothetical protein ABSH44_13800 [Bryobacteraceae bacterium]|jgi:hypothetical protein
MTRKAYIIGILAVGLMATAIRTAPAYGRLVSSAQSFQHYFQDLKGAGTSLSPVERLVFSLVLANTRTPQPERPGAALERRT